MPSHPTPNDAADIVADAATKFRTLAPVLVALATFFVAAMQVVNGLPVETVAETLVVGWVLATPVAALLLWPTPSFLPTPGDGGSDSDSDPLARLKRRYADGDIDAEEFERRVETILTADATVRDDADVTGRGDGELEAAERE